MIDVTTIIYLLLCKLKQREKGESLVIYIMKNHHHKCVIDRLNLIPFPCMTTNQPIELTIKKLTTVDSLIAAP